MADVGAFMGQLHVITATVSYMLLKSFAMPMGIPSVSAYSVHISTASNASTEKYSTSGALVLQAN